MSRQEGFSDRVLENRAQRALVAMARRKVTQTAVWLLDPWRMLISSLR